jgi:hypothetical protein
VWKELWAFGVRVRSSTIPIHFRSISLTLFVSYRDIQSIHDTNLIPFLYRTEIRSMKLANGEY